MVLEIGFRSNIGFSLNKNVVLAGDHYLRLYGEQSFGISHIAAQSGHLLSAYPVLGDYKRGYFKAIRIDSIRLEEIQNEVSGILYDVSEEAVKLLLFSTKVARSRLFYIVNNNTAYFSLDLRELLPYSEKKLNQRIAYAIVKFGEVPEYNTVITDIFSCPVSSYTRLDTQELTNILNHNQNIYISKFQYYHKINYGLSGGNTNTTKEILSSILAFLSNDNPYLLVSGGLDSSLLNFLYNEIKTEAYPALFYDFDEARTEREYVIKSVAGTKAELTLIKIDQTNFIDNFNESIESLIYPVYDNGSALVGKYFFNTFLGSKHDKVKIIDGTVADSCYGVRNYNSRLTEGRNQSLWTSYLKEWIHHLLLLKGIDSGNPRDAFLDDVFLQDLLWYGGPFVNIWFKNAKSYTVELRSKYHQYYNIIGDTVSDQYWEKYTVLKMLLYAAKQTAVKTYDMFLPHETEYPFMYQDILIDQGKYSWNQKSEGGVTKHPIKKILEEYIDKDFIYRKKVGLQSQTMRWINQSSSKPYFSESLARKDGVAYSMMGRINQRRLANAYQTKNPPVTVLRLVLSMVVIQKWCDLHQIAVEV